MVQINELITEIALIRSKINTVEVRGVQNMSIIIDVCAHCEHMIEDLNHVIEEIQNERKTAEEGEVNAESDTESS